MGEGLKRAREAARQTRYSTARNVAADAVALSVEHANRAEALERRWQALKAYLGSTIDADAKVFESFAGTPQQPAFGGLLTANRNTLAKMTELEAQP